MIEDILGVKKLIFTVCALEMIHSSSIILYDLTYMDNANIRRGKSTNHMVYGHDKVILASVVLLMRRLEIVASDSSIPGHIKNELLLHFTRVVGAQGMTGGQFIDLKYSNARFDGKYLDYIHPHKTTSIYILAGLSVVIIVRSN